MRVLVCGGRYYKAWNTVWRFLQELHDGTPIDALIHGSATGADTHAARWAYTRNVRVIGFPADWHTHGKAAGPIRNQRMLDEGRPDLVVAFPGGSGTQNMIDQATRAGVPVRIIRG